MLNLMPTTALNKDERPEFKAERERLTAVLTGGDVAEQECVLLAMNDPEYQARWKGWESWAVGMIGGDIHESVLWVRPKTSI